MAAAIAMYFVVPGHVQRLLYNSYSLVPAVAIVIGAHANRSPRRKGWYGIAGFLVCWSLGDLTWAILADDAGNIPLPSAADPIYFLGYPFMIAGILSIYRRRTASAWRIDDALDALIFAICIFVIGWTVSISSSIESLSLAGQIVSVGYPAFDTFVLGVTLGLVVGFRRHVAAERLLIAALTLLVFADSGYGFMAASGSFRMGLALDAMWLSVYTLLGAAALHPSMAEMGSEKRELAKGHFSTRRVMVIGIISAVPALSLLTTLRTYGVHVSVIATLVAAGSGIVIWRLGRAISSLSSLSTQHERMATELSEQVMQQERAKEALSASEQMFRSSFEDASAGMTIVGIDGTFQRANAVFARNLGYEPSEIPGKRWADFKFPEDRSSSNELWQNLLQQGSMGTYERRYRRKDGSEAWGLVTSTMVKGSKGENLYALAQVVDISAHKEADAALAKMESQLRQAQKMEAVGQLAGGIAHDFNNILAVIMNYADFVIDDLDVTDPRRADVEEIVKAGEKAAQLVHQLLAFSRKEVVEPRVIDLNAVIEGLQGLLERSLGEDIELVVDRSGDLPSVKADPGRIEQILMNLAVNGRDAMPAGGTLTISTGAETIAGAERNGLPAGEYVRLTVSDTGIGMDEATIERVFEPFFTTKARGEGTGLGLATVYGIVKQASGGIYVDSADGEGSTFAVYLPPCEAQPTQEAVEAATGSVEGDECILVVEDEEAVRHLVSRILTQRGYQVVAFGDGSEALAYYEESSQDVDLLLTDVVMPKMSGRALADRALGIDPGLKTLFMSGYTDELIAKRGVLAGGEHLIKKPFNAQQLLERVQAVLAAGA